MYSEGQEKAKVGRVQVDIKGKSYRVRFTYPEGTRHEFSIARVSDEGWVTAIKAAQMIDRDINLGDFDETYARYSPKHARKIAIAQQEKTKEYNLKELWEIYKESNKDRVAKTTQARNWTQFDRFLEKVKPDLWSLKNSEKFIQKTLEYYAVTTVSTNFRTCLHPAINQAVKKKLIEENPYKNIKLPKIPKKLPECFDPDEVKAIIKAFYMDSYVHRYSNKNHKHSYYAPMVEFLALTGCRPEECHALTWNDIKSRNQKMFIKFNKAYSKGILLSHTKTHEIRLFPCNEQLKTLINRLPKIPNKNNLIFPSIEVRNYIDQTNFRNRIYAKVVKGLVKDGKVHKYLKPYCLRHSFITRLIRDGVDIATVAALSGNSVEVIMSNYLASRREFDLPEL
ncbi:MAG: tyrosine-type recombinase/integrase [Xenococcaceae cyanobacterium MO_207.B15]|nr:tyrosine-type recombinase/integrase [Xenococcaceae cyanobacterium MO_207.B15]